MISDLEKVYASLFQYCKNQDFAGFDPFDGLNSRIFQATPLKYLAPARLAWLQMVKRSATDLRPRLRIDKGENAKGIALFALAELSRFIVTGSVENWENTAHLLERLRKHAINGTSPAGIPTLSFGYNFDWQSRAFYAPKGTPTIVPTAFAARAFVEAYEVFDEKTYLDDAVAICEFIVTRLNRPVEVADELCFSYSPIDKSVIFNASLLAGETLASVGKLTGNEEYLELAKKTARFVVGRQQENGSWLYGSKRRHKWVDNFHTAYILLSLQRIDAFTGSSESEAAIHRGFDYWLANFFLDDGTPKYFDAETFPVDIHSSAAAIVVLCDLSDLDARALPQAIRTADWTIRNLRSPEGYFYYQQREKTLVKTPFIRWGESWMAFALARLIEVSAK